jgi:hypothetical protein
MKVNEKESLMTVFIYLRKTRCSVQLFASEKQLFPKGSVPVLKSSHPQFGVAQHVISQMMGQLRANRGSIVISALTLEGIFRATEERAKLYNDTTFARAKFVPTSYTSKGMVYSVAKVEIS